jgi:hypothetical protein
LISAGAGALAIMVDGYVPLMIHELQSGFAETRGILDYLAGGGRTASTGLAERIVMVGMRSVIWPLAGLLTDRPVLSMIAAMIAAVLAAVAVIAGRAPDRRAARWLLGSLAWSVLALAVFAPSLAVVIPGLPNDHYHAFLDPLVLALAGVGVARLVTGWDRLPAIPARMVGWGLAAILVAIGLVSWPPAVAEDGGWRLVDEAAARVAAVTGDETVGLDGIPPFKSADALRFPLLRHDVPMLPVEIGGVTGIGTAGRAVVVCDPLFDEVVGSPCGGPAEDAWVAAIAGGAELRLVDRFDAGPRRVISVYTTAVP